MYLELLFLGNALLFLLWAQAFGRQLTDRCPRCGQKETP